jgi:hypothetical protein
MKKSRILKSGDGLGNARQRDACVPRTPLRGLKAKIDRRH